MYSKQVKDKLKELFHEQDKRIIFWYETDEEYSFFIVRLPIHENVLAPVKALVEAPVELSKTEHTILLGLQKSEQATKELLMILGYKQKTGNFKASIERLLSEELIEYTIPDKPNSRLQKYRLTNKGREFFNE